jgi:hypothetical protein
VSSKKHVCVPNFLTKPPPHVFLGQKGLFGAFWGKNILHKNFPPFCLLSPQNSFSEKHVSGKNFFTKPHNNNYRGETDYMERLGAKLFRSEVLCLRKSTFRVPSFLTKPPPYVFLGQNGPFSAFRGKNYLAPKLRSILPPKPPK